MLKMAKPKSQEASSKQRIKRMAFRAIDAERNEGLRQLGEFFFEFSQLEFTIRVAVSGALRLEEDDFNIVTGPYDFAVLCTVAQKIFQKRLSKDADRISSIFNRCRKLNESRVRAAHGLWTDSENGVSALHVARSSLEAKTFFDKKDELKRLAEEAQALMQEVLSIH